MNSVKIKIIGIKNIVDNFLLKRKKTKNIIEKIKDNRIIKRIDT